MHKYLSWADQINNIKYVLLKLLLWTIIIWSVHSYYREDYVCNIKFNNIAQIVDNRRDWIIHLLNTKINKEITVIILNIDYKSIWNKTRTKHNFPCCVAFINYPELHTNDYNIVVIHDLCPNRIAISWIQSYDVNSTSTRQSIYKIYEFIYKRQVFTL